MLKKVVIRTVICCLLGMSVAGAQTLSPVAVDNKPKPVAPAGALKTMPKTGTQQKAPENRSVKLPTAPKTENTESRDFTKSVKNIGNQDANYNARKYDNRYGRVFTFHLKNGHIEFDNNDERKILVWYENFKVIKGMDGLARCSIRVFVLNDLTTRINNLGFKIIWPDIRTSVNMTKVNPGVNTYVDTMLIGDGCFTMDRTPVIEVNRCRVKGMSEEKCADAVHWYNRH